MSGQQRLEKKLDRAGQDSQKGPRDNVAREVHAAQHTDDGKKHAESHGERARQWGGQGDEESSGYNEDGEGVAAGKR